MNRHLQDPEAINRLIISARQAIEQARGMVVGALSLP